MRVKNDGISTRKERLGYYGYFVGQNIVYIFVTIYLSIYYTTALGIPAATVGTILLAARIWDAVNDPILSIFIEKANLKSGKFKPWIRSVAVLIPVLTVLVFGFTDFLVKASLSVRIGYAALSYVVWGMAYTISDAPAFAMATIMTTDMDERNRIISFAKLGGLIGVLIAMVAGPLIVNAAGGNWMIASLILSAAALILLLGINFSNEHVRSTHSSPSLKQILKAIFYNKYLVIVVVTLVLMNGFNFGMTITPFLAEYVFDDPSLASVILGASILPMLVSAPLLPVLVKKFGKNSLMKFSLIIVILFSAVIFFTARENFLIFLIFSIIKSTLGSFILIIGTLFFADAIEYDYFRSGRRFEAAVFSAQTFSNKVIGAVAGAGAMYLISIFGFKESMSGEAVVQTRQAVDGIWMTYNLGPLVGAVLSLIFFSIYYDLDEAKLVKMGEQAGRL